MTKTLLRSMKLLLVVLFVGLAGNRASAQSVINIQDSISTNTHWTACNQYLLFGYVYVTAGTTLTIDPGTIIKGDKNTKGALIVERGATIIANGTAAQPIIFTSNQPMGQRTYGDWGGIIVCGKSPCNWLAGYGQVEGGPRSLYGGNLPHDNSGILRYIRIEFAGVAFSPNNEVNGLTLCSVGDATQVDHIQVSYSGDDSYEWFGGTVNAKYLVSYRAWDDDFDTDCGFRGKVQFGFVQRDPYAADQSGSKAFESDSYQSGTKTGLAGDTTGLTMPVFSNITVIGPMVSPTSTAFDPQFVSAAQIRRGSALSLINCVVAGWPCGVLVDESSSSFGSTTRNLRILGSAGDSILQLRGNIISGIPTNQTPTMKEMEYVINGARSLTPTNVEGDTTTGAPFAPWTGPFGFYKAIGQPASYNNFIYATEQTGVQLHNPFNLANPDPVPNSISPICWNTKALPAYVTAHYTACCSQSNHFGNGNVYPFNPTLPINTDTSNWFANYNAPVVVPVWNSNRVGGSFFTHTNYVGGFSGTQTTADNWMNGWCNFDPVNTDYSLTSAPLASISTVQSTTICPNSGSVLLQANSGSGYTYQWMLNNANIVGATSQNYTATTGGTYNVVVSNATGCSTTSANFTVNTYPAPTVPTITPNGPTTFCNGGAVMLASSQTTGIIWTPGNLTTSSITVISSGNYMVTYTDNNGCQATASQMVTVNANPTAPSVTVSGNTTFCTGDSVQLSSSQASGNQWMDNNSAINGATSQDYEAMASGIYTVQYTDANGCSATSAPIQVSVSSSPAPTVGVTGSTALCPGETVTLTASTSDSYLWSPGGQTTQNITVSAAGNYSVTVTNSNACNGTGTSSAVTVTQNTAPTAGFSYVWNNTIVVFSNTSTGGTLYNWDFGDQSSSSAQTPQHQYLTNGTYTVTLVVTNAAGCTDTITNVVQFFVGVQEHTMLNGITLYPNPANENVNLVLSSNQNTESTVSIYDMNGRLIVAEKRMLTTGDNTMTIDVTNMDNGIYFVNIVAGDVTKMVKFVVSK